MSCVLEYEDGQDDPSPIVTALAGACFWPTIPLRVAMVLWLLLTVFADMPVVAAPQAENTTVMEVLKARGESLQSPGRGRRSGKGSGRGGGAGVRQRDGREGDSGGGARRSR